MPDKPLLHSAVWARELIAYLQHKGVPTAPVLRAADVSPRALRNENARLPFREIAGLYEAAAKEAGDDLLGFRFGQTTDFRDAGLISYVGLSSPTLRDAVLNIERYMAVFSEASQIDASMLEKSGKIAWRYKAPASVTRRQLVEWAAVHFLRGARMMTGRDLRPEAVTFVYPRRDGRDEIGRFFGCDITFGARENSVTWSQSQLDLPLVTRDHRLAKILKQTCEDLLSQRRSQASDLVHRVEMALTDRAVQGVPDVGDVARTLGMSKRTLSRRLAEEGTSFRRVLDGLRRVFAEAYLKDSDLSLTEIAFLLGYSDLSSFSTAFRRWTGKAPRSVRAAAIGLESVA
ncbi:MAG: AraC family transcriptional regulator [Pseudomonadota bacterium]